MARRNEVETVITLEDRLTRELQRPQRGLGDFQSAVKKAALGVGILAGATAGFAVTAKSFIAAAQEQSRAEQTLARVLSNVGVEWENQEKRIKEVTSALQTKTGQGDERQIRALSRMVAITGDLDQALQALPVVLDAAAVSGSSLETVAGTLTRALAGQANTAESLGITFEKEATFSQRLEQAMRAAGGAAEANRDPFETLGATVGDLQEAVGRLIEGPAVELVDWLTDVTVKATEATDAFNTFISGMDSEFLGSLERINETTASDTEKLRLFRAELNNIQRQIGELTQGDSLAENLQKLLAPVDIVGITQGDVNPLADLLQLERLKAQREAIRAEMEKLEAAMRTETTATVDLSNATRVLERSQDTLASQIRRNIRLFSERHKAQEEAAEQERIHAEATRENLQAVMMANASQREQIRILEVFASTSAVGLTALQLFEDGELSLADALEFINKRFQEKTREVNKNTNALTQNNIELERMIRNQERLTGKVLRGPGNALPPSPEVLTQTFTSLMNRAIKEGFTRIDEEGVTGFEGFGQRITLSMFADLANSLFESQGLSGAEAILRAIQRIRKLLDFEHGGVVPGPIGKPQLVVAHGGEEFAGVGNHINRGGSVNIFVEGSLVTMAELEDRVFSRLQGRVRRGGLDVLQR